MLVAARVVCSVSSESHCAHNTTAAFASIMARMIEPTEMSTSFPADAVIAADISRTSVVKSRVGRFIELYSLIKIHKIRSRRSHNLKLNIYRRGCECSGCNGICLNQRCWRLDDERFILKLTEYRGLDDRAGIGLADKSSQPSAVHCVPDITARAGQKSANNSLIDLNPDRGRRDIAARIYIQITAPIA